ncbi:MAB_1171c family putative transporter [Streptomyces sp. RFCAC02]|uniref:MAB_1171c family putative transporter n=1 Tax=Streptomyces sp. RFCAC02 TaxID=2499143 RepID=UPI0010225469|nr:MAB_1171c family putative transporter [Streptomyces sp. RFCAC02]
MTLSIGATALLWAVTLWRALSARESTAKRALWVAFLMLACAMTIRPTDIATTLDDRLDIPNLSFLIKHLCAISAAAALASFVREMADPEPRTRGRVWWRTGVTMGSALALIALFFATPQHGEAEDLVTDYADDWRIALYGLIWTGYLGIALCGATRLCWRYRKVPRRTFLGRGLRYAGVGTVFGIIYCAFDITSITLRYFELDPVIADPEERISGALLIASLFFVLLGSTFPAFARLVRWARDYRDLLRLYSLWRELTDAVPTVRLETPRGRLVETISLSKARSRLYRRAIELRDAILVLGAHAPGPLRQEAHVHAESCGLSGEEARAVTDACWIRVARASKLRGDPPCDASDRISSLTGGGGDLSSEIRTLRNLAAAYDDHHTHAFAENYRTSLLKETAE